MNNLKTISGWGLYPKLKSYIYETNGQVDDFNKKNNDDPVTIRGNGRSYGDSSIGYNKKNFSNPCSLVKIGLYCNNHIFIFNCIIR